MLLAFTAFFEFETRLFEYKKIYGDELLIFDKKKAAFEMESGDNFIIETPGGGGFGSSDLQFTF